MTNSTVGECLFSSLLQSWFSSVGMFILAGLLLQSFIVAVNVIDWLKGRSMTATDQIITSIGITRIIYNFSCPLHLLSYSCTAGLGIQMWLLNVFTGISAGFSSIWLSALLATFFCIKISTFNNNFFLHLKTVISQRVLFLIFTSVLLGFGYAFTLAWVFFFARYNNLSYNEILHDSHNFPLIFIFNCLWNIFPVLIFFVSSVLLVICLGFHIRQMKKYRNVPSSTDTNHKMIMFTSLSFLSCALCGIVNLTETYGTKLFGILWMYVLWNIFPVLHSVSIIYVSTKLRDAYFRSVHWGINFLFWRKPSELDPRELMEVTRL